MIIPKGYQSLWATLNALGRQIYGPAWTGLEPESGDHRGSDPKARERVALVRRRLHRYLDSGNIRQVVFHVFRTGQRKRVPARHWLTEEGEAHLAMDVAIFHGEKGRFLILASDYERIVGDFGRVDPRPDRAVTAKPKLGTPGRPSLKAYLLEEHKRRALAGELLLSVSEQAAELLIWLRERYPDQPQYPTPRTIEHAIREAHRRAVAS